MIDVIYKLPKELSPGKFKSSISQILKLIDEENLTQYDWLTTEFLSRNNWPSLASALREVHSPSDINILNTNSPVIERLAFEEMVSFYLRLKLYGKSSSRSFQIKTYNNTNDIFVNNILDFNLTNSQKQALCEISEDLESSQRMNRLLYGDVGSGKSIIAYLTILKIFEAKKLSILLSPTELLARQHYQKLLNFFKILEANSIFRNISSNYTQSIELLVGSNSKNEKLMISEKILSGNVKILIGTHAIIQDKMIEKIIHHNDVGLVVIDEEQRFGVVQRDKLSQDTNVLYMTATPIPRTLENVKYLM